MKVISCGVELAVYQAGQAQNPTIVLIHGYPDNASVWHKVVPTLAQQFHVVTYDVRGCGQSYYAPARQSEFLFSQLAADLRAVIDAVSPNQPVHLVGHDWGALQGWEALLSGSLDGRVASWSCAAPPLDHIGLWFHERLKKPSLNNLWQVIKRMLGSSYMLLMQIPILPELTWRLGLSRAWPKIVSALEGEALSLDDFQRQDALVGLALYRANLLPHLIRPRLASIDIPVQFLRMSKDPFVPVSMFESAERFAPNAIHADIRASHWGLLSQGEAFATRIAHFIQQLPATPMEHNNNEQQHSLHYHPA